MARVQSTIGAAQHYGPRTTDNGLPSGIAQDGPYEVVKLKFDWEQANAGLPTADADTDQGTLRIPANAIITRAYLLVTTAFTSGGSATLELGLEDIDGTTEDADGLDSLAVAALTLDSVHVLDGAKVGATVGTDDVQVIVDDATAAFTAGEAVLVVEYLPRHVA